MVIVDSDVWSEAFRKKGKESSSVLELRKLISLGEIILIGPIRQEILSGIREELIYEKIRDAMRPFPSQRIDDAIYETAASFFNHCRRNSIQGSHTDYLICACAVTWKASILTKDKDFTRYAKFLPIKLHQI